MPARAIEEVGPDYVLPAAAMGALLGNLTLTPFGPSPDEGRVADQRTGIPSRR